MAYSSGQAVAIACVFSVLPIVVVTMRFMSRRLSSAKCGIDDWLILPALVCVRHFRSCEVVHADIARGMLRWGRDWDDCW